MITLRISRTHARLPLIHAIVDDKEVIFITGTEYADVALRKGPAPILLVSSVSDIFSDLYRPNCRDGHLSALPRLIIALMFRRLPEKRLQYNRNFVSRVPEK
jgi:hypothetical protein